MSSLSSHPTAGPEHGQLRFHPHCPVCRNQRNTGAVSDSVLPSRARAALLAAALGAGTLVPSPLAVASDQSDSPGANASQGPASPLGTAPEPAAPPTPEEPSVDTDEAHEAPVDEAPQMHELLTSPEGGTDTWGEDASGEWEESAPAAPSLGQAPSEPAPVEAAPVPPDQAPAPAPVEPPPIGLPPAPPQTGSTPSPQQPPVLVEPAPSVEPEQLSVPNSVVLPTNRNPQPRVHPRPYGGQPIGQHEAAPHRENVAADEVTTITASILQSREVANSSLSGRFYTVQSGDSLWSIARRLVGPSASPGRIAREVNRLWEVNRDQIHTGDPSLIYAGTVLRLG